MARMSIDDSIQRDPRVKKLARLMGWHRQHAVGALLDVWSVCYDRATPNLTAEEVDLAAEVDGFCERMIECDLARDLRGDGYSVRIAGVEERIGYLQSASERGRKGGVKSGESRRSKHEAQLRSNVNRTARSNEGSPNPSAIPSASASALPPAPASAPVPVQEERERESAAGAASSPSPSARRPSSTSRSRLSPAGKAAAMAVLRKLGEQTGIEYRGGDKHTRLILGRYHDGFDELDLRKIIAYAARTKQEGGLGWNSDEKMRHCLRPETLFGPETIERYVDAARSWFKQRVSGDPQPSPEFVAWREENEPQPKLAVVK